MKYLPDTNVFFDILYDPAYLERYRNSLRRIAPRTYLSSIVRFELLQGAQGDVARARVARALQPLERVGRTVAPLHTDWTRAGVAQGRIWDEYPSLRTKHLQNDLLIACTARRIGAIIITENHADFEVIRPHVPHRFLSITQLAAILGAN